VDVPIYEITPMKVVTLLEGMDCISIIHLFEAEENEVERGMGDKKR
jgi:hypothetical protein